MPNAKINLLIVDDNASLRSSLTHIFTSLGHTVRCAEDGFSALREIRESVPDILLSDLNMPGMSGFELLSVVRRRFPTIQAIAMSGAFAGQGLQLGVAADAFYEKGAGLGVLLRVIHDMTQLKHQPYLRALGKLAPIWIPRNGHNPVGEAYVMITCPECLRSFPQVLSAALCLVHETTCVYCSNSIHYAIIQPTDPAAPQDFQRKPNVAAFVPRPIADSN